MYHERKSVSHFSIIRNTRFELINALAHTLSLCLCLSFTYKASIYSKFSSLNCSIFNESLHLSSSIVSSSFYLLYAQFFPLWTYENVKQREKCRSKILCRDCITLNQWTSTLYRKIVFDDSKWWATVSVCVCVCTCTATVLFQIIHCVWTICMVCLRNKLMQTQYFH